MALAHLSRGCEVTADGGWLVQRGLSAATSQRLEKAYELRGLVACERGGPLA